MTTTTQLKKVELYDNIEDALQFLNKCVPFDTFQNCMRLPGTREWSRFNAVPLKYMADERQQEFEHLIPVYVKGYKFKIDDTPLTTRTIMATQWIPFRSNVQIHHSPAIAHRPDLHHAVTTSADKPEWGLYVHEFSLPERQSIINNWYEKLSKHKVGALSDHQLVDRAQVDYIIRDTKREIDLSVCDSPLFLVSYVDHKVIPLTYRTLYNGARMLVFSAADRVGFVECYDDYDSWESVNTAPMPTGGLFDEDLKNTQIYNQNVDCAFDDMNTDLEDPFLTDDLCGEELHYRCGSYEGLVEGVSAVCYAYLPVRAWLEEGDLKGTPLNLYTYVDSYNTDGGDGGEFRDYFGDDLDPYGWYLDDARWDLLRACDIVLEDNYPVGHHWEYNGNNGSRFSGQSSFPISVDITIYPPTPERVLEARAWCRDHIEPHMDRLPLAKLQALRIKQSKG